MSYRTQALLAGDVHIINRVAACAATQGIDNPMRWAWEHNWKLSAAPGWDASYAYALAVPLPEPGDNDGVITDATILATVQSIIAAEGTPPSE